jgi:hypothetical protein
MTDDATEDRQSEEDADMTEDGTEEGQPEADADRKNEEKRASILSAIDHTQKKLSVLKDYAEEREQLALDAEARSFSLPPADETDKILRYEGHMDRQLYRAMDQLERGKGEKVPPPLNINLGRNT